MKMSQQEKSMESISYEQAFAYLAVIREMIQHENQLMNQRLGWLFTIQGLLFVASSFLLKGSAMPVVAFGIVGVVSCISIGYTLDRGVNAIRDMVGIAQDYKKSLPTSMVFPPTIGSRSKAIEWLLPAKLLPWVLGIAWIAIVTFRVGKMCP